MQRTAPQGTAPQEPLGELDKARILAEETYRQEARALLEARREERRPSGRLRALLASNNFRWVTTVVLLPLLGVLWGGFQHHLANEEAQLRESLATAERAQRESLAKAERERQERLGNAQRSGELLVSLMPYLSDPNPVKQKLAFTILGSLSSQQALSPEVEASLAGIIQDLNQQAVAANGAEGAREKLEIFIASQKRYGYAEATPEDTGTQAGDAPEVADPVVPEPIAASSAKPPTPSPDTSPTPPRDTSPTPPRDTSPTPPASAETKEALPISLPRVYIQIGDEAARPAAEALRAELRQEGALAPGVENVVATLARKGRPRPKSLPSGKVLYFHDSDEQAAQEVVERMRTQGLESQSEKRTLKRAPRGQIEVWLGNPGGRSE